MIYISSMDRYVFAWTQYVLVCTCMYYYEHFCISILTRDLVLVINVYVVMVWTHVY